MASDFILQNICRIHQIQYPKRPLFRVKSQKNNAIEYATLIAPEITSDIKPGIYGSLLCAHWDITVWRICIIASLNASVNAATVASRVVLQ